jgi:hypothetical protein
VSKKKKSTTECGRKQPLYECDRQQQMQSQTELQVGVNGVNGVNAGVNAGVNYGPVPKLGADVAQARLT